MINIQLFLNEGNICRLTKKSLSKPCLVSINFKKCEKHILNFTWVLRDIFHIRGYIPSGSYLNRKYTREGNMDVPSDYKARVAASSIWFRIRVVTHLK